MITYVSKAFCKSTGYSEDELLGQTHAILKDKDTPNEVYQDLWMTIKNGHTWRGEFKNHKKDMSAYWIYTVISPIFDKHQNITGFNAITEDITYQKMI